LKSVLITGGSRGFGFEFAKLFARDGYRLILVAKPPEELAAARQWLGGHFPETEVQTLARDLSLPGAGRDLYDWTVRQNIRVDVLVNNAGFGTYGFFDDIDLEKDHEMFRLNALTMYELTRLFARDMIARDAGKILIVSSTSALQPTPLLSSYSATKAFVYQLAMGYDYELRRRGSHVRITTLCPPAARTGFMRAAGMERTGLYHGFWSLDAPQVAAEGYRALMAGKRMHIPGPLIGFLMKFLNRILPISVKLRMVYDKTREK
jgi:uncharacterized protein